MRARLILAAIASATMPIRMPMIVPPYANACMPNEEMESWLNPYKTAIAAKIFKTVAPEKLSFADTNMLVADSKMFPENE
jgi:hypothetical protein